MSRGALLLLAAASCGPSYTPNDSTANVVALRAERMQIEICAAEDAGFCTPSFVRASSALAYCANARELVAHGVSFPDAGVACRPQ